MYSQVTPFLMGKLDGMAARPSRNPFDFDEPAYDEYAAGYRCGREVS